MTRRPREITIIQALQDRALLGGLPAFQDLASWRTWLVFLRAVYGLPLDALERLIFERHTHRTYDPPHSGYREVVAVVGRQSGKTRIAGTIAGFEAMTTAPEADGTDLFCALIAQDQRASLRTLFSYARAPFDRVPVLVRSVTARRAETLTLDSGCVLSVYPCRPQAVRGIRARVVICDELAFYRSSEGFPTDTEMLRAVRPTLATTDGKLIILSSPYAQTGALYELHRRHFGRADSDVLVWQASAPAMNPTLPADYLARMEQDDPEAYRSEVLGEFRAGVSTFLDPEAIAACVAEGIRERPPIDGVFYVAFVDPSGGRRDAFTVAIAHRDGERAILDVCRAWPAPFNPSGVIAEASDLLRRYRISYVEGDRFGGEFAPEQFRAHGVSYRVSERDRSAIYFELLPLVTSARILLLDQPELLRELRGLERRRGSSGRDRIDHAPNGYDDRANVCAGVLGLVTAQRRSTVDLRAFNRAFSMGDLTRPSAMAPLASDEGSVEWEAYRSSRGE